MGECRSRPSLLALELLWRWLFGLPLLALLGWAAWRIWQQWGERVLATGVAQFSLVYALQSALQVAKAWAILEASILHAAAWILPLAIVAWAVAAGLGRNAVIRRWDGRLPWRPGAMIALQLLRVVALCAMFGLWFLAIRWSAAVSLAGASAADAGGEPNLVRYCTLVILFSLGTFIVWALLSWVFSIAPLLVVLEGRGVGSSLVHSLRLGPLTGKLIEINLIMCIVKLGLGVLAMVFSSIPLPFEAQVQGTSLYLWWAFVTLLYLIVSDFFQVARVAAYVELWRDMRQAGPAEVDAGIPARTPVQLQ